ADRGTGGPAGNPAGRAAGADHEAPAGEPANYERLDAGSMRAPRARRTASRAARRRRASRGRDMNAFADTLLVNGKFSTLDPAFPQATGVAIVDGRIAAVGEERELARWRGAKTTLIELSGRRVIPGLIDSHMHVIRGGLNYNLELRWDG